MDLASLPPKTSEVKIIGARIPRMAASVTAVHRAPTPYEANNHARRCRSRSEGSPITRSGVAPGSDHQPRADDGSTSSSMMSSLFAPPSSLETAPHFEPEVEEGNIEHKLHLSRPSEERLLHLTTQLNWRLNESPQGVAFYLIGVRDDGFPEGLPDVELRASIETLGVMAGGVRARLVQIRAFRGVAGGRIAHVRLQRTEIPSWGLTRAHERVRVAVLGGEEGGKSTLVGVLTTGKLDNGQGLARMQVFRHNHEVENGRTSSVSQHILGFRRDGSVANYKGCMPPPESSLQATTRVGGARGHRSRSLSSEDDGDFPAPPSFGTSLPSSLSAPSGAPSVLSPEEIQRESSHVLSFIDLAGHAKYLKTTFSGITGLSPDHAMVTLPASAAWAGEGGQRGDEVGWEEGDGEGGGSTHAPASQEGPDGSREQERTREEKRMAKEACGRDGHSRHGEAMDLGPMMDREDPESPCRQSWSAGNEVEVERGNSASNSSRRSRVSDGMQDEGGACLAGREDDPARCRGLSRDEGSSEKDRDALAYLELALSLRTPLFVVLTKADLASEAQVRHTMGMLQATFRAHRGHRKGREGLVNLPTASPASSPPLSTKAGPETPGWTGRGVGGGGAPGGAGESLQEKGDDSLSDGEGGSSWEKEGESCWLVRGEADLERAIRTYASVYSSPPPGAAASRVARHWGARATEPEPGQPEGVKKDSDHTGARRAGEGGRARLAPCLPVFLISSVTGQGLDLLRRFLRALPRSPTWAEAREDRIAEVHIDASLDVEGVGCVLAGAIDRGRVSVGDRMLLGPLRESGVFEMVVIRSLHLHKVPVRSVGAGQCVTLTFAPEAEEAICLEGLLCPESPNEGPPCSPLQGGQGVEICENAKINHERDVGEGSVDERLFISGGPRALTTKTYKGIVLVSPAACPVAAFEFEAEIVVLSDTHGPLSCNLEPSLHIHKTRQTAKLLSIDQGRRSSAGKGETVHCRFRFLFHAEYVRVGMMIVVRIGRTVAVGWVVQRC